MNLNELEKVLFSTSSELMKNKGREECENGLVRKIMGKRFEDIYSIYGDVLNPRNNLVYSTYIKVDLKKKCIEKMSCTCEDYRELSLHKKGFMCSHLNATCFRLLFGMKGKTTKKENDEKERKGVFKVIRRVKSGTCYYEVRDSLGKSRERISEGGIREFLEKLQSKKVKFTYEYLEMICKIIDRDIPLSFTIKRRENEIVVTSHKKLPISLSSENNAYFYKREIYLPSKKQCEGLSSIIEELSEKGEIILKLSMKNYNNIISEINKISDKVDIREEIRSFISPYIKPEFMVYMDGDCVLAKVYILYGEERINVLESDKNVIREGLREEVLITKACGAGFKRRGEVLEFMGNKNVFLNLYEHDAIALSTLGKVILAETMRDS